MLPQERYQDLLELLKRKHIVKIEDIVTAFHISVETARRDLNYLEKEGLIKKIYGGATLAHRGFSEPVSNKRLSINLAEKEAIGRKCSEFIQDGEFILLEGGTTTLQVAKALRDKKDLTILTNSIYIVNELIDTDINVYIIGGKIRHEEKAVSGAISMFELDNFNITKAIIGAGAISVNGISDYNIEEALMRKRIIERSKQVILTVDHSKFEMDSLVNICPISDINYIITGKGFLAQKTVKSLEDAGTRLIFAD